MDKAARVRWSVLCTAFAGTVGAILYPVDEDIHLLPSSRFAMVRPVAQAPAAPRLMERQAEQREWIASDENPFAPRLWQALPAQSEAPRTVVPVATGGVTPPAPALPLPYVFLGQMMNEGSRVVYLGRGDQLLLAHSGDILEGTYKVVEIGSSQMEFETVATGLRQTLPIPEQNKP